MNREVLSEFLYSLEEEKKLTKFLKIIFKYKVLHDYNYISRIVVNDKSVILDVYDNILENRFNRHIEMAKVVREWGRKYFELFPQEDKLLSNTLTTIKNTRGISVADLNKELGKRGFVISNGYGDLKEKTFRIAHMADCQMSDIKELLENIEDILGLK